MPPKNEKIEKKEAVKPKNFFDLDDDDAEEIAENKNTAPQKSAPAETIKKDRLKELGANMRGLFHEDKEDDLFEEKEEEEVRAPVEQQSKDKARILRKEELRAENPHLFYDGGIDLNDKMQSAAKPDDTNPSIRDFYQQLDQRLKDKDLAEKVRSELTEIITSSGIKDQAKARELAESTHSFVSKTMIDAPIHNREKPKMSAIAPEFFGDAYFAISEAGLDATDQVIAAQNIADVMLKNYSPAAILTEELAQYTDKYVVKNRELLKERLEMQEYPPENIDEVIEDVQAVISGKPKPERKKEEKQLEKEPSQITKKKSIFGDDELEDEEGELEIVNNLDHLKGSITPPKTGISKKEALDNLRKEVLTNKATRITKSELLNSNGLVTAEDVLGVKENDTKTTENQAKPEDKKSEDKKSEDKKSEDKKSEDKKPEDKNPEDKKSEDKKPEDKAKPISSEARVAVFMEKLKAYNNMYKQSVDANDFAFSVSEAWTMMKNGDEKTQAKGKQMMRDLFKDTLKKAFDTEKDVAYSEHRMPDYNEIIKSSNELVRAAMFGFTDLYHDPKSASLFEPTAFGGMNAKEMAELTKGESIWNMDQKSHKAWEIQSKDAKQISNEWLSTDRPYETLINEMNELVEANKTGIIDRKVMLNKLAAAEWMLMSNEKMMIENPEDPINPIPNWGNRYWKALTSARESLGIDKHTSMRELIQGEYAESAKAVNSTAYNETQINDYVLDPEARAVYDSMDIQKEQFATQSAAVVLSEPEKEKENDKEKTQEERLMTELRIRISIKSEDQRDIMKNEPKSYNFISEKTAEVQLDGIKNTPNV